MNSQTCQILVVQMGAQQQDISKFSDGIVFWPVTVAHGCTDHGEFEYLKVKLGFAKSHIAFFANLNEEKWKRTELLSVECHSWEVCKSEHLKHTVANKGQFL